METIVIKVNNPVAEKEKLQQAGDIIKRGGLVGFPTETVYGLGADALNEEAAARIYAAKGRPSDNPLIVHISNREMLLPLVKSIPDKANILMDSFWPGPMTLIFNKSELVPKGTTGGLDTVAIRMPDNEIALGLIEASGTGIAAPSGNLSGKPSPTMAEHMIDDMDGRIDMIIDGGMVGMGLESTIIDLTGDIPTILRPGFITKEMLEKVIGQVEYDKAIFEKPAPDVHPKAPGMKYRHYAPAAEFTMYRGEIQAVAEQIKKRAKQLADDGYVTGIITTYDHGRFYSDVDRDRIQLVYIGNTEKPETIANNLYKVLRDFDKTKTEYILGETFATNDLGQAIMNRLTKAAGYNIVEVPSDGVKFYEL